MFRLIEYKIPPLDRMLFDGFLFAPISGKLYLTSFVRNAIIIFSKVP